MHAAYYDDASWLSSALLRFYQLSGQRWALDNAHRLLSGIIAAYDTSCCGTNPGTGATDRPFPSTGPIL
jgi:hypothetical protein